MENSLERQKKKSWVGSFVLRVSGPLCSKLVAMFSGGQKRFGSAPNAYLNKPLLDLRRLLNESLLLGITKQKWRVA